MVSQEVDRAGASGNVGSGNGCQEKAACDESEHVESEVGLTGDRDHAGKITLLVHSRELKLQVKGAYAYKRE